MRATILSVPGAAEFFLEGEGCHTLELSNSDADPALSIARARVEVGEGPARDMAPGDVVLIPPGCAQRIANAGDSDLVFLALCTPRYTPAAYEPHAEAGA
jgi:oxalate decarboxylase/phosphoglucose isomerase-like protein (cupin superfamily)